MNTERAQVGWGFWLRWVLANAAGLAVGLALWGILSDTLGEQGPGGSMAVSLAGLLLVGGGAGTLQWLALRPYLDHSRWSILAGSVGYAVGFVAGFAIGGPPADFIFGFLLFGLGAGIVQWLALRRQVSPAGWWVPTSMLGLAIGGGAGVAVIGPFAEALDATLSGVPAFAIALALLGTIAGGVGGAITGGVLVWLLRQPAAKELGASQAAE